MKGNRNKLLENLIILASGSAIIYTFVGWFGLGVSPSDGPAFYESVLMAFLGCTVFVYEMRIAHLKTVMDDSASRLRDLKKTGSPLTEEVVAMNDAYDRAYRIMRNGEGTL